VAERQAAIAKQEHADADALNTATWFYLGTAAADWSVTAVCDKVFCGDRTQTGLFIRGIEDPKASVPLGLAVDALTVILIRQVVAPYNQRLARVLLYGLGGARVVFVANKVNDLRDHTRRVP